MISREYHGILIVSVPAAVSYIHTKANYRNIFLRLLLLHHLRTLSNHILKLPTPFVP